MPLSAVVRNSLWGLSERQVQHLLRAVCWGPGDRPGGTNGPRGRLGPRPRGESHAGQGGVGRAHSLKMQMLSILKLIVNFKLRSSVNWQIGKCCVLV